MKFTIFSGFDSSTKKKSWFKSLLLSSIKYSPEFTLWAFNTIFDFAACLKILSNVITLILSDSIIHFKIFPGPTDGS